MCMDVAFSTVLSTSLLDPKSIPIINTIFDFFFNVSLRTI